MFELYEGKWGFSTSSQGWGNWSVGIFQWVKGVEKFKHGKVQKRIKANGRLPKVVYAEAQAYCDKMNNPQEGE